MNTAITFDRAPDKNVIVVGYPRSGNTWLSRTLGDLLDSPVTGIYDARPLAEEGLDRTGEFVVRQLHLHPDFGEDRDKAIPSGNEFFVKKRTEEKIVFVIRDPRDVCVSAMHYWELESIEDAFEAMKEGITPLKGAGRWSYFIYQWEKTTDIAKEMGQPPIPWVRYEDLKGAPYFVLDRLLYWWGLLEYDYSVKIPDVVERQSFDVRREEIKTSPYRFNYGKTIQLKSMRKGIIGDWRNFFSDELEMAARSEWGDIMERYGYD